MNGKKFEYKVASYLRGIGYRRVKVTKTSGDYGVDIIAYKRFHKYAVQCKYYSKPVGIAAVQQVVAGMAYYNCDRAIVVTNNTFTRQAKQLAEHNDVELIEKVKPYNMFIVHNLLRLCGVCGLYLLYKLGYNVLVYILIGLSVLFLILGLYIKYSMYVNNRKAIENADIDDNVEE